MPAVIFSFQNTAKLEMKKHRWA